MHPKVIGPSDFKEDSREIQKICETISKLTGVQLGESQRGMVVSRLKRRSLELGLNGIEGYLRYFSTHEKDETEVLVSLLTTHHTYFFREFSHFEFLANKGLSYAVEAARKRNMKKLRIWSAACSRGQECYSLSMFLSYHLSQIAPDFTFEILGTDVDGESIAIARNGVFPTREIMSAPLQYLGNHWAKGSGEIANFAKAKDSIKKYCRFEKSNLLNLDFQVLGEKFDFIFCRNVFIYFTPPQIKVIVEAFKKQIYTGGHIFVGISESLTSTDSKLKSVGPSIYQHLEGASKLLPLQASKQPREPEKNNAVNPPLERLLRVVCVDDSPVLLMIMKKILTKEHGFEIVATAKNGIEASKILKTVSADLMTLDFHMPEQTGLEYLQSNYNSAHPPVVMVTAVSREDEVLAKACMSAGAADFVEKPDIGNLNLKAEEIRAKLKSVVNMSKKTKVTQVSDEFYEKFHITHPEKLLRIIMASPLELKKVKAVLAEFKSPRPPTFLLVRDENPNLASLADIRFSVEGSDFANKLHYSSLAADDLYVCASSMLEDIVSRFRERVASILLFGKTPEAHLRTFSKFSEKNILMEDSVDAPKNALTSSVDGIAPSSSFAYMSNRYLAKWSK